MQERRDRRGRRAPALAMLIVIVLFAASAAGLFGFLETDAAFGTVVDLRDKYFCDPSALVLDFPDLSRLSEVYTADGVLLGKLNERNSQPVPFEDIPDIVKWALLSAEDGGFYDHQGVDFKAIARAALDNVRSGNLIGGSTITQQVVKQNFLSDERTIERKICEAVVAAELERRYTKDQILEFYMNAQYFGENAYGVRAAAQEYFGKDLEDLTIAEAAAMVVPIRNPSFYDLRDNPVGVLARRNDVIDQMADNGFITVEQATQAKRARLRTVESQGFVEPAPQVLIAAQRQLLRDNDNVFGLGATYAERKQAIFGCPANDTGCEGGGGLKIYVTVNFAMQEEANRILREWFRYDDSPTGAIAMVDNRTGAITVMASGLDYGEDIEAGQRPYDLATEGARQAGSAFKPFGLLAALESGGLDGRQITLNSYWDATSPQYIDCGEFPCDTDNTPFVWEVSGGNRAGGIITLEEATYRSVNAVYAQVSKAVGPKTIAEMANRVGINTYLPGDNLSIVLGTDSVSPLEMAAAYSTIANYGLRRETYLIDRIEDEAGNIIYKHDVEETRVVDEALAAAVVGAMKKVVQRGTATRADIGRPQAGKTGTTQRAADVWFMGYIPQYTAAVWVGYADSQTPLEKFTVYNGLRGEDQYYANVFGGTLAAPIWKQFMQYVTEDLPVEDFPPEPPGTSAYRQVPFTLVPDLAAVAAELNKDALSEKEISSAIWHSGLDVEFDSVPSTLPEGTVIGQDPAGGTRVRQGSKVLVHLSSGAAPEIPNWRGINALDIGATVAAFNDETGLELTWVVQEVSTTASDFWNTVISTDPSTGSPLNAGDQVTFYVAVPPAGPPPSP